MRTTLAIAAVSTLLGVLVGAWAGRAASEGPPAALQAPTTPTAPAAAAPAARPRPRLRLPPTQDCMPEDPEEREHALLSRRKSLSQELALTRGFRDREYGTHVALPSAQFDEPAVSAFFADLERFGDGTLECVHYPCKAWIPLTNPEDYDALEAAIREEYPDAVIQHHNNDEGDVAARVQFAGPTGTPGEARRLYTLMNLPMEGM